MESKRKNRIDSILEQDSDALTKVRQIIHMGLDEDEAEELVSRYQLGQMSAQYYERLDE
jgi:hypothetical protein